VLGVSLLPSGFPAVQEPWAAEAPLGLPSPGGPSWDLHLSSMLCLAEDDLVGHTWWVRMIWWVTRGARLTPGFLPPFHSCHSHAGPAGSGEAVWLQRQALVWAFLRSSLAPPGTSFTYPHRANSGWEASACRGRGGDLFLPLLLSQQSWCWNHLYFINAFTAFRNSVHRDPLLQLPPLYMHRTSHAHCFLEHTNI